MSRRSENQTKACAMLNTFLKFQMLLIVLTNMLGQNVQDFRMFSPKTISHFGHNFSSLNLTAFLKWMFISSTWTYQPTFIIVTILVWLLPSSIFFKFPWQVSFLPKRIPAIKIVHIYSQETILSMASMLLFSHTLHPQENRARAAFTGLNAWVLVNAATEP